MGSGIAIKKKLIHEACHLFPSQPAPIGQNIYIENTSPDCDIQITITGNQTGEVMYEQLVPQAQTSYIIISIASFPSGEYTLELTSEDGKYLVGAFKR